MIGDNISLRLETFAVAIMALTGQMPRTLAGEHIAGQLVRAGTSPGANYEEARAAESRCDFIHKLRIALKELREAGFWLRIAARSGLLPEQGVAPLLTEAEELCRILGKSIATCRARQAAK